MEVTATTQAAAASGADTIAVGLVDDEGVAHDTGDGALAALLDAGEARTTFRHVSVTHADGVRWILVGLGDRDRLDGERARGAAHAVCARAAELGTSALCWEVPHHVDHGVVAGLVEGTLLSAYRFDRYRSAPDPDDGDARIERLVVSDHHDVAAVVARAALVARAQNAARDLQNRSANDLTPMALADRAAEIAAAFPALTVEVLGRAGIVERGMGAFAAVAQGSEQEPALIVLRHDPPNATGPILGIVGKAVTFDAGGISIKPAGGMADMKFDMSGGAAALEAAGAIAELGLPLRTVTVIGATENLPSGTAVKPGDVVRAMDGTTIQVDNTDAEGRMVLADCLLHARALGAERLIDLATLTGGMVTALGNVYAGAFVSDEDWAAAVLAASAAAGEPIWRMPLHERYADAVKGRYADLTNAPAERRAQPIAGAEFLHRFAGDVPWAHLDIAGVASDAGLPYLGHGGSGWGVRLLVTLAETLAASDGAAPAA
jgi:leucyl aminopeptidase